MGAVQDAAAALGAAIEQALGGASGSGQGVGTGSSAPVPVGSVVPACDPGGTAPITVGLAAIAACAFNAVKGLLTVTMSEACLLNGMTVNVQWPAGQPGPNDQVSSVGTIVTSDGITGVCQLVCQATGTALGTAGAYLVEVSDPYKRIDSPPFSWQFGG